jgi:hypothetical protein
MELSAINLEADRENAVDYSTRAAAIDEFRAVTNWMLDTVWRRSIRDRIAHLFKSDIKGKSVA